VYSRVGDETRRNRGSCMRAWLWKLFPSFWDQRIFLSRQEVFFFWRGRRGMRVFAPPALRRGFQKDEIYGSQIWRAAGLKLRVDRHGGVSTSIRNRASDHRGRRGSETLWSTFPALRWARRRVRSFAHTNTWNGDF